MNQLRLPDLTFSHMPVVPTARMRELKAEINVLKAKTLREIECLESEYDRLTVIEQHKVFAEHNRRIIAREKKRFIHHISDDEILAIADEIRKDASFGEHALKAAYADSHNREAS